MFDLRAGRKRADVANFGNELPTRNESEFDVLHHDVGRVAVVDAQGRITLDRIRVIIVSKSVYARPTPVRSAGVVGRSKAAGRVYVALRITRRHFDWMRHVWVGHRSRDVRGGRSVLR